MNDGNAFRAALVGDKLERLLSYKIARGDGTTEWSVTRKDGSPVASTIGIEMGWRDCVRAAPDGLLLEFGVRGGESLEELAVEARNYNRKVYGFDWWRGLPHDWDQWSPKGSCLAAKPDVADNVELFEGLFSDTLDEFLSAHPGPVGFVNVDCDLYSSSLYVLHCLADRFQPGSLISLSAMALFPTLAQRAAWERYLLETGQRWEWIGKPHAWGEIWKMSN